MGVLALLAMTPPGAASDEPFVAWPDDRFHRLAALALLEQLRGELLAEPSATLTLGRWCVAHGLSADGRLVADRIPGPQPTLDRADRALLQVGTTRQLSYRHVRLSCNGHPLSEADNWYVADRLTPAMNHALETTDTPFGRVVLPLGFARTTLSSRMAWSPLPADWARLPTPAATGALTIPDVLIENRALLRRGDGLPFSLVVESYRRGLLDFRPPSP